MVIPIGDRNPARRTPWVMRGLILANLIAFFGVQPWTEGQCAQVGFFLRWAAIPAEIVRGAPLMVADLAAAPFTSPGLVACTFTPVADKPVYLAALASLFLHAGILHLLGNLLFLWIFGNNIEDQLGHLRFLVFYVAIGVATTAIFVAVNPTTTIALVGASGAISAVLGAYLVMFPVARVTVIVLPLFFLPFGLPALIVLGGWFLLQLRDVGGAAVGGGGVAYLAHVAGFVLGAVTVLIMGFRPRRVPREPQRS